MIKRFSLAIFISSTVAYSANQCPPGQHSVPKVVNGAGMPLGF